MAKAKNQCRGEQHYRCKLTDNDIENILDLAEYRSNLLFEAKKITNKKLAEKFGVVTSTIEKVISGERR